MTKEHSVSKPDSGAKRTRLSPDERRQQLITLGARMLRERALEDVSISEIAEQAGISRGLLFHYFPTKQDFHLAIVAHANAQLLERTTPDPNLDPFDMLRDSSSAMSTTSARTAPPTWRYCADPPAPAPNWSPWSTPTAKPRSTASSPKPPPRRERRRPTPGPGGPRLDRLRRGNHPHLAPRSPRHPRRPGGHARHLLPALALSQDPSAAVHL